MPPFDLDAGSRDPELLFRTGSPQPHDTGAAPSAASQTASPIEADGHHAPATFGSGTDGAPPADGGGSCHPADDLGWGDQAWDEAGGFDAVVGGGGLADVLADILGGHGSAPVIFNFDIGTLDVDLFNVVENTLVQNTEVMLDASHGGSLTVGGDVSATGSQAADGGGFNLF